MYLEVLQNIVFLGQSDSVHQFTFQSKMKIEMTATKDLDEIEASEGSQSHSKGTPRLSDDEYLETYRCASPFVLDRLVTYQLYYKHAFLEKLCSYLIL